MPTGDLDKWKDHNPFSGEIFDGAVHGRGACDMKAGVAANMAVARALRASGVILEKPFAIHSVISEEDGGLGAFGTMLRGHDGEAAVITEATSGRIVTANAGALTFEIRVPGRAAHGSTRLEGVSAFDAFLPVHRALAELERERNASPDALFARQPAAVWAVHRAHPGRRLGQQRARPAGGRGAVRGAAGRAARKPHVRTSSAPSLGPAPATRGCATTRRR